MTLPTGNVQALIYSTHSQKRPQEPEYFVRNKFSFSFRIYAHISFLAGKLGYTELLLQN